MLTTHSEMHEKRDSLSSGCVTMEEKMVIEQPPPPPPHRDPSDPTISAKKLPKKRKFDPSELEEMDKTSNVISNVVSLNTNPNKQVVCGPQTMIQPSIQIPHTMPSLTQSQLSPPQPHLQQQQQPTLLHQQSDCYQSTQTVVQPPPQSTAVDYSLREEPSRSRPRPTPILDLSEWRDHHVLALRDSRYYPGVIKDAGQGEIYVEFEGENTYVRYSDVLGAGKYDIISDASPSVGQVKMDAKVCVRYLTTGTSFINGTVCKILTKPQPSFVVRIQRDDDKEDTILVKRADLRLVQPPWWDELEESMMESESRRIETVGMCLMLFINNPFYFI